MSNLTQSNLTRSRLAALSLAVGSTIGVAVPAAAAPPSQAVEITYTAGSPLSILPDKATLFTTWITPMGRREELSGGKTTLHLYNSPLAYTLDPKTKQAIQEPAAKGASDPDQVFRQNSVGKVAVSYQTMLGYRCLVKKGTLKVRGILTPAEVWVATVAGQRVMLKTRLGSSDNLIMFVEAVEVQTPSVVPLDLMRVPAGYTITAPKGTP